MSWDEPRAVLAQLGGAGHRERALAQLGQRLGPRIELRMTRRGEDGQFAVVSARCRRACALVLYLCARHAIGECHERLGEVYAAVAVGQREALVDLELRWASARVVR